MNRKRRTAARNCNTLMQLNIIQGESQDGFISDCSHSDQETDVVQEKKALIGSAIMSREFLLTLKDDADFNTAINAVREEFLICETLNPTQGLQTVYPLIHYQKKAEGDIEIVLDHSGDEM
jgi:hypothetical protein